MFSPISGPINPFLERFYPLRGWHFQPVAQKNRAKIKNVISFPILGMNGKYHPYFCQNWRFLSGFLGQFVKKPPVFFTNVVKSACPDFRCSHKCLANKNSSIFVQTAQKPPPFVWLTMCSCVAIIHKVGAIGQNFLPRTTPICPPTTGAATPLRSAPRRTRIPPPFGRRGKFCISLRVLQQTIRVL